MTAIVAAVKADRVELLADAACYDSVTGTLVCIATKILPMPGTSAVFVCRGPVDVWPAFDAACRKAKLRSFDDFVARSQAIFADFDRRMAGEAEPNDIVVAGFSNGMRRPLLCIRTSHDRHAGVPAGALVSVASFSSTGRPVDPATFDLAVGLAEIEHQRRTPTASLGGGPLLTTAGGHVDHVEIRAGRVPKVKRVHEWAEDRVGEPLAA